MFQHNYYYYKGTWCIQQEKQAPMTLTRLHKFLSKVVCSWLESELRMRCFTEMIIENITVFLISNRRGSHSVSDVTKIISYQQLKKETWSWSWCVPNFNLCDWINIIIFLSWLNNFYSQNCVWIMETYDVIANQPIVIDNVRE